MTLPGNPKNRAILYMLTCALLWSTAGIFLKLLPWNAMVIAGMRSLISAGIYILFMRHQKITFVINKYSLLSGFFLCGVFIFFIAANKLTAAANAIVLQYSAPIFIIILSALIFKQKFRKGDILAVAATSLGIALFFLDDLSGGNMAGNLLAVLAGIFFASMFITTGRADDQSRSSGILLGHVFTAIIGVPFIFFSPTPVNPTTVMIILALGIFQLGIPYILYGMAARHCSALACSLISGIEPLLNPTWVFLFTGELPGLFALAGGAVVLTAVFSWTVWSNRFPPNQPPAADTDKTAEPHK
jgi:drug/metabolite transporter (DMT)-like permease